MFYTMMILIYASKSKNTLRKSIKSLKNKELVIDTQIGRKLLYMANIEMVDKMECK